jgi:hypothetical protein
LKLAVDSDHKLLRHYDANICPVQERYLMKTQKLFFAVFVFMAGCSLVMGDASSNQDYVTSRRMWAAAKPDDGSIACLGNGKLCVYERGPNIIQLFGPPYSSGSIMCIDVGGQELTCESQRRIHTAIWDHRFSSGGKTIATVTDFVDTELPCFARKVYAENAISFLITFAKGEKAVPAKDAAAMSNADVGLLIETPAGKPIYNDYPFPTRQYHRIAIQGNAALRKGSVENTWEILCNKGETTIYISGGPGFPECTTSIEKALDIGYEKLAKRTTVWWQDFSNRRYDFNSILPKNAKHRQRLLRAIDDVSVLIKVQMSEDGGVLAGHNYHLAYVRDQYGVARCLLALGYLDEVRVMLVRDWRIWQRYGTLHNAAAIGVDGIFHVHEDDDVELTGYLIIQAFNYADASGDKAFLKEIEPMLAWAFEAQKNKLAGGMVPFNGDETYFAGGILPRSALNDGSAEATMLFLTGGQRLVEWAQNYSIWSAQRVDVAKKVLNDTEASYYKNFWKDDRLIANNPERTKIAKLPKFRHGVCEKSASFGWTIRNRNGRYVSLFDTDGANFPAVEPNVYDIKSVSLMPLYINSKVVKQNDLLKMLGDMEENYRTNGTMPSRPDGDITVGYDYGLMLYNLTKIRSKLADEIYDKMFSLIDPTGAWVEYYDNNQPRGTRYRPWESGINLEAAIIFAMWKK